MFLFIEILYISTIIPISILPKILLEIKVQSIPTHC